jgi:hypothetical protein
LRRFIILILFVLAFAGSLHAQNDGAANTGLSFLKLGVSSRSIALGDAVVSDVYDASATHYNPAALTVVNNTNVLFMHNSSILGVRTEYFAGKVSFTRLSLGISLNNTSVGDIEVREIPGQSLGTFNAQNFALGLSGAYKISPMLSIGVTAKFLYEKIYIDNASGFAFDFGGLYQNKQISIGLALANAGSMNELRNTATKLPTSIRLGASYLLGIQKISSNLRIALDGYKVLDGGKFHANAGAEFLYKDFLAVRAGYQSGYDDRGLTTGLGLKYGVFNLDYAFVPYKYSLGNSHTFTLGCSF